MNIFTFGHATDDAVPANTATYDQANAVAGSIAKRYPKAPWLYGVGVGVDPKEGFFVTVRADPKADVPPFPKRLNGVAVRVERREMPSALVGEQTLDSDLMNFTRNPISWRTEIGAHLMGEKYEESLKGV